MSRKLSERWKIVECFTSIQSEGFFAGTAAQFIRFYGCNLKCVFGGGHFCDEPLHTDKSAINHMSTEYLLTVLRGGPNHIVITGGEPTLQNLNGLIATLRANGYYVQIETNGAKVENVAAADFITYSPKHLWDKLAPSASFFDEVKVLGGPGNEPDVSKWRNVLYKYIQPIAYGDDLDVENIHWCHDWVLAHPDWKLSLQTHKFYGAE